jgi:hypothetical protein
VRFQNRQEVVARHFAKGGANISPKTKPIRVKRKHEADDVKHEVNAGPKADAELVGEERGRHDVVIFLGQL